MWLDSFWRRLQFSLRRRKGWKRRRSHYALEIKRRGLIVKRTIPAWGISGEFIIRTLCVLLGKEQTLKFAAVWISSWKVNRSAQMFLKPKFIPDLELIIVWLLLLLYIVLTISSLIGQEPPSYFENSRDFVDKHDYSIICYPIISADYTVRSAHLWLKSASTWMVSSDAAAWCVCPCIFTSTNKMYWHFTH